MGSRFLLRFRNEVKAHPCDIQPRFLPWDREWETAWSHAKKQLMMTRSFVGKRHAWWDFPVWMLGICDGWQPLDRWGIDVIWKFKIHCQRQEMFVLMKAGFLDWRSQGRPNSSRYESLKNLSRECKETNAWYHEVRARYSISPNQFWSSSSSLEGSWE